MALLKPISPPATLDNLFSVHTLIGNCGTRWCIVTIIKSLQFKHVHGTGDLTL